jgi:KaiC/GvpD/RAD55 family RecA-like ATPase
MKKRIQLFPSGIPLVDFAWGGFYRGGTYLLVGPHKSGRTILSLQYAMECAKANETCLYFTSVRPKDLLINAASIDFDLQHYMNNNSIIVVRVTPPTNIEHSENPDSYLVDYIKDISNVVNQYQPNKVVFDEITPFVGFRNLSLLKDAFLRTIENIEDHGVTSLFVIGEPATPGSQKITETIQSVCTGLITLKKSDEFISKNQPGQMSISPLVGHAEGKFTTKYFIEAYRGIKVDFKPKSVTDDDFYSGSTGDRKYKSMAEFELPEDTFSITNLYSLGDFKLILNNQIIIYPA